MVPEHALKNGTRGEEIDSLALEAVVLEVAHVDVAVAAVEDPLAGFGLCVGFVFANVAGAVFVPFL